MTNTIKAGDIVEVTFFKKVLVLRVVENWVDQLLCVDDGPDDTGKMMIAPIQDCKLVEERDPPTRTFVIKRERQQW